MQLTPSAKSSFIAGLCVSAVAWSTAFHLDEIAKLFRVQRLVSKDGVLGWMTENKVLTLIFSEFINFGMHGVTSSASVSLAIGSTAFNTVMIFLGLPLRKVLRRKKLYKRI